MSFKCGFSYFYWIILRFMYLNCMISTEQIFHAIFHLLNVYKLWERLSTWKYISRLSSAKKICYIPTSINTLIYRSDNGQMQYLSWGRGFVNFIKEKGGGGKNCNLYLTNIFLRFAYVSFKFRLEMESKLPKWDIQKNFTNVCRQEECKLLHTADRYSNSSIQITLTNLQMQEVDNLLS